MKDFKLSSHPEYPNHADVQKLSEAILKFGVEKNGHLPEAIARDLAVFLLNEMPALKAARELWEVSRDLESWNQFSTAATFEAVLLELHPIIKKAQEANQRAGEKS